MKRSEWAIAIVCAMLCGGCSNDSNQAPSENSRAAKTVSEKLAGENGSAESRGGGAPGGRRPGRSGGFDAAEEAGLRMPEIGDTALLILTPRMLELRRITTKAPDPSPVTAWDFVGKNFELHAPAPQSFEVRDGGRRIAVRQVGLRRRVRYAPLKRRDLRIGNSLFLELAHPLAAGDWVSVKNPAHDLWPEGIEFQGRLDPQRWSPAIHVNQVGYLASGPKEAMAGYYLGSLGELDLGGGGLGFSVIDADSGRPAFSGTLRLRPDAGFTFSTYQKVLEADFTPLRQPGRYRLRVDGLGVSYPFWVGDETAGAFARAYALGLYHQRCGTANALPFTRFVHGPCHTRPAEIPTPSFKAVEYFLREMTADSKDDPNQSAPPLSGVEASLYPFVRQGEADVSGGHHDAGDYSKYTINSAGLAHALIFAADVFPGAARLDNLGLPESGDGKSDLLEEAKWETDFLAKMQDADGGFYFLVYPKDRAYEDNVLPDHGDPQVVFPKTTAVTAAAVAALAQASSSPLFRRLFPAAAADYWKRAQKGWDFLQEAIRQHGRKGAYQKITHYGAEFGHEDELAWAAAEMFLATGDKRYERELIAHFDPASRDTKRWTWVRMFEGYGCAMRSYVFAERSGRRKLSELDPEFLAKCRAEALACGEDQARFARECAYGTSFPDPTKRFRTAGWYFSEDPAFDIAVALQLDGLSGDQRRRFERALISDLNYAAGCNPVNVCYITGLGWKRPREIVNQYAQNDRRALPPSGLLVGNIQGGFQYLDNYKKELGALSFPPDGAEEAPYPFYDRWGDSFNTTTECVVTDLGRALAVGAYLMAQDSKLRDQPWRAAPGEIVGVPEVAPAGFEIHAALRAALDMKDAVVVWEAAGMEPTFANELDWAPSQPGPAWAEVEAQWPDGRRVFAAKEMMVVPK